MKYKTNVPDTNTESYTETNGTILINVPIDQIEELEAGSISVTGKIKITKNNPAVPLTGNEDLYLDPLSGVHSLFQTVTTKINGGIVESLNDYYRYAHMYFEATGLSNSMLCESKPQREMRNGYDFYNNSVYLAGQKQQVEIIPATNPATYTYDPNGESYFACELLCAANRTLSNIPGSKINSLYIQLQLRNAADIFYGTFNTPANYIKYTLSEIKVMYRTRPQMVNPKAPIKYIYLADTKTTIDSTTQNITLAPTGNLISLCGSFIDQANENNPILNNSLTEVVPNVKEVEFFINGGELRQKFPMKNLEEILINYIQAVKYGKFNVSNSAYISTTNVGFGVGLFLNDPINMNNSRISFKLVSGINRPYSVYFYFTTMNEF